MTTWGIELKQNGSATNGKRYEREKNKRKQIYYNENTIMALWNLLGTISIVTINDRINKEQVGQAQWCMSTMSPTGALYCWGRRMLHTNRMKKQNNHVHTQNCNPLK